MSHVDTYLDKVAAEQGPKKANILWATGLLVGYGALAAEITGETDQLRAAVILAVSAGATGQEVGDIVVAGVKDSREEGHDLGPGMLKTVTNFLASIKEETGK